MVYGEILDKLAKNENVAIKEVGFPLENRKEALESLGGTSGQYQNFVGGQIYQEYDFLELNDAFMLFGVKLQIFITAVKIAALQITDPLWVMGGTLDSCGWSKNRRDIWVKSLKRELIRIDDGRTKNTRCIWRWGEDYWNKKSSQKILKNYSRWSIISDVEDYRIMNSSLYYYWNDNESNLLGI